jgi:hypothetical protein
VRVASSNLHLVCEFRATCSGGPGSKIAGCWRWHRPPVTPGLPSPLPPRIFRSKSAPAAILLYLLLSPILSIPYVMWGKRHAEISNTIETAKES